MTRPGQQLPVFVLSHFFTAFLDHAAQKITPLIICHFIKDFLYHQPKFVVQLFLS
jgi:hypothetical protein